jgi:hypothetical protein
MKLPFGVNSGPATYQRHMDFTLTGLKGLDCLAYVDDLLLCYYGRAGRKVGKDLPEVRTGTFQNTTP